MMNSWKSCAALFIATCLAAQSLEARPSLIGPSVVGPSVRTSSAEASTIVTLALQVVSVRQASIADEGTRAGNILFARLRFCGLDGFTVSSQPSGLVKAVFRHFHGELAGLARLAMAEQLLTVHSVLPDGEHKDRQVLERRRGTGMAVFRRKFLPGETGTQSSFYLTSAHPLFGTPHLKDISCKSDENNDRRQRIYIELTDYGRNQLAAQWERVRHRDLALVLGGVAHGPRLRFSAISDGRISTIATYDAAVAKTLVELLTAGCNPPPLTVLQQ